MQKAIRTVLLAMLALIPVTLSADNECVPWACMTPPGGCSYCDVTYDNGNTECSVAASGHACIMSGFCNTGMGGCDSDIDCALRAIVPRVMWVGTTPRPLREEWTLVRTSVKPLRAPGRRS